MSKEFYVNTLQTGCEFTDYFMVKAIAFRVGSNHKQYMDATLGDCTGEINAKKWDVSDEEAQSLAALREGDIVKIKAGVSEWNNIRQLRVTRIRNICAENVRASKARHLLMVYGDVRDPVDGVTLKNVTCGETTEERLVVVNAKNVTMDGVPLPSRPGKAPAR